MQIVGGYSLVRLLGAGSRAEVFLGRVAGRADVPPSAVPSAAIKLYRPRSPRAEIDTEIDVLARLSHQHLLRLDDLTTAEGGSPALILQRLDARPLSQVLLERGELAPGEVVSIVAPVATAVEEMHRSGVAHRRLRTAAVLFDDAGAPVIAKFGRARVLGPVPDSPEESSLTPAARADHLDIRRDVVDLCAFARSVAEASIPTAEVDRFLDWLDDGASSTAPDRLPQELAKRAFDVATAAPIDLTGARPTAPSRVIVDDRGTSPHRGERASQPRSSRRSTVILHDGDSSVRTPRLRSRLSESLSSGVERSRVALTDRIIRVGRLSGVGDVVDALVGRERASGHGRPAERPGVHAEAGARRRGGHGQHAGDGVIAASEPAQTDLRARVKRFLSPVSRSVWVTAIVSLALLVGALLVIPTSAEGIGTRESSTGDPAGSGRTAPDHSASSDPTTGPTVQSREVPDLSSSGPLSSSPPPTVEQPTVGQPPVEQPPVEESGEEDSRTAIGGDDPVVAATALLRSRLLCWESESVACLSEVHQADSAALEADSYSLSHSAGEDKTSLVRAFAASTPILVQRLGDSAILSITQEDLTAPASLLLVRSEAGWRIRDLIVG